ncbi:MAG: phosphatidylglycerol lysyltransferase [Treponema sp.]|jgi:phosphoglucomutase|nr:phosphatidylglycerol lysyltransferase [Treponema sp.]
MPDKKLLTDLDDKLANMILSASGWRTVFAESGEEEDKKSAISKSHKIIVAVAAKIFADYVKNKQKTSARNTVPVIMVGMDARPTGRMIAETMIRTFLHENCRVLFASITAAPEIMAFSRTGEIDGFVYISASHNPIGHNGLKFGLTDGGVLPGTEAKVLIDEFRSFFSGPNREKNIEATKALFESALPEILAAEAEIYRNAERVKQEVCLAYLKFTKEVVADSADLESQTRFFEEISANIKKSPIGIVADFNGSARTVSIDKEFLPSIGVKFRFINGEPGRIAHRIVPEGESLVPCAMFLEEAHSQDPCFILGYVPDCDGDRGNLVIWDDVQDRVRPLEAQEVFALACVAELSHLARDGNIGAGKKVAVVVNDPTSLRIDQIAKAFGVDVFRAEVGEANVVGLARNLRERGWIVRVLGEGPAGGNITYPSSVRDPIDTVFALLKLLTIRGGGGEKGFFEIWCELSGNIYRADFTIADVIKTLPSWVSTGSYSEDALLQVKIVDHALLKDRYQTIFLREWREKKTYLAQFGIVRWNVRGYIGMEEIKVERFGQAGRGGLKICFLDQTDSAVASIWMRGSGTEPVFRIMADAQTQALERELIAWQQEMVKEADGE